jgi:hypothetical protein
VRSRRRDGQPCAPVWVPGHRDGHALGDLLAFPLRHGRHHREEEPPSGGAGVDSFLERNEVGSCRSKQVREFEKLTRIARQPGKLAEHERGDVAGSNVAEHPLRFRLAHDCLSADRL